MPRAGPCLLLTVIALALAGLFIGVGFWIGFAVESNRSDDGPSEAVPDQGSRDPESPTDKRSGSPDYKSLSTTPSSGPVQDLTGYSTTDSLLTGYSPERPTRLTGYSLEKGPVLSGYSTEKGPVLSGYSSEKGPVLSGYSSEKGPVLSGYSSETGPVLSGYSPNLLSGYPVELTGYSDEGTPGQTHRPQSSPSLSTRSASSSSTSSPSPRATASTVSPLLPLLDSSSEPSQPLSPSPSTSLFSQWEFQEDELIDVTAIPDDDRPLIYNDDGIRYLIEPVALSPPSFPESRLSPTPVLTDSRYSVVYDPISPEISPLYSPSSSFALLSLPTLKDCMRACTESGGCRAFSHSQSSCHLYGYRPCWLQPSPTLPVAPQSVFEKRNGTYAFQDDYEIIANVIAANSLYPVTIKEQTRLIPRDVVTATNIPRIIAEYLTTICRGFCREYRFPNGGRCRLFQGALRMADPEPDQADIREEITCHLRSDSIYDQVDPVLIAPVRDLPDLHLIGAVIDQRDPRRADRFCSPNL